MHLGAMAKHGFGATAVMGALSYSWNDTQPAMTSRVQPELDLSGATTLTLCAEMSKALLSGDGAPVMILFIGREMDQREGADEDF